MATEGLEKAFAGTRAILANVTPDQYADSTPCASWSVRDVVNHIVEGANWFPLCVNAGAAPDPDPTHGFDYAAGDVLAAYDKGSAASVAAFGAPGAQERMIKLPFGELPGAAFMGIATNDVVVHGWDLAQGTGQLTLEVDPDLVGHLLSHMKAFTDPMRGPDGVGAFGPEVTAGEESTALDRLLAYMGRRP